MTETSAVAFAAVDQVPEPGFNPGYWHELIDEKLAVHALIGSLHQVHPLQV